MEKILVADDDSEIAELICTYLENDGFAAETARDGMETLAMLRSGDYQLLILDIMMPGIDGLEVCRQLRKFMNIPVIMLSAKSQDIDKITGLSFGADDYMIKPFNPLELLARVKSQLRRYLKFNPGGNPASGGDIIDVNGLMIDIKSHEVTLFDKIVKLTPIEFDILSLLARNRGMVFSSEAIFSSIWNEKYYTSNNTVIMHIRNIREKLGDDTKNPRYIKTIWGVGYKIEKE